MEQVKIFRLSDESGEERVNKWLESMNGKIEITRVLQSIDCGNLMPLYLTIFFKKLK